MQRRLSLSSSSSPSHSTNRVTSSFLAPPPLPSLRRSSSRSLLSPLNTSHSPSSAVSAVSSAPPATPSRPIPISPPSAHSTPNSLPHAGGRAALEGSSNRSHRRREGEEEEEGEESEGGGGGASFTIPIIDTRLLPPLRSSGAPTSTLAAGGAAAARGAGGRRLSSLASYTGLPGPPQGSGAGAGGAGGDELRYSLASFRSSYAQGQAQAQGLGRRPSVGGSGIVRPPSPAPEAFARGTVGPLTSSGGAAGEVKRGRRESVVLGQGSLAALASTTTGGGTARRAPSPARPHAHAPGASGASGLVRSASTSRQSQNAARSPSPAPAPARGDSPRVVRGFDPPLASSSQRAPSPARFVGGAASAVSPPSASASHLSARRASLSATPTSALYSRPSTSSNTTVSPTSPLTRPRSRLANPQSDQHLEVAASRDIAALDAYYYSRQREGLREGRREAEERLRVGYDRLQREQ
ncbi:RHTO0S23e01948g1_1 [Rhodotorula toruloides]|uniref:RHTO0S23e01948g1_1 n=2 Tax=Rhodotorula toruloides TaxID=5286 RepID=A0A061BGP3_RHOTO|nr:uncharacterized protein RHTO_05921 [Rhodotorula toruloides NP11]EMS18524.1 hypothetical protein RHTO_05921 [Rhodotorula toruloides NP11]CDR49160.1 RHTO0S23e01948g1_1 [Rhodotorula toruloides]